MKVGIKTIDLNKAGPSSDPFSPNHSNSTASLNMKQATSTGGKRKIKAVPTYMQPTISRTQHSEFATKLTTVSQSNLRMHDNRLAR